LCPGPTETNFSNIARGQKVRLLKTSKMPAETVVRYGHRTFRSGKVIAIPGLQNRFLTFLLRITPRSLVRKIIKRYNSTK
jgi:short-subunit dehydrogenase